MNGSDQVFTIRHAFLLPLGLLLLLCVTTVIVGLLRHHPTNQMVLLAVMTLPVLGLFAESVVRQARLGSDNISVHKLWRWKTVRFDDITSVDTLQVRKRAFITLSTENDFLIFSNAYSRFPDLVASLLQRVPAGTISPETRAMADHPPVKSSDIITCWFAVVLMTLILYLQFLR